MAGSAAPGGETQDGDRRELRGAASSREEPRRACVAHIGARCLQGEHGEDQQVGEEGERGGKKRGKKRELFVSALGM